MRRPLTHRLVVAFNLLVATGLVAGGAGLLWLSGRVTSRQVVSLEGGVVRAPEDGAAPAGSDWTLDTSRLAAQNYLLTGSDNGACTEPGDPTAGGIGDRTALGERSDTIMLVRLDPRTGRAAILSFPRDLWVDIAGTTRKNRINSAFERTDPSRLVRTIDENFGIPVDHYVNVDFCAFKEIVTAVDGVKVPFAYPTRDRKTGLNVPQAGCATLDGDQALAYVRSRAGYSYYDPATGAWRQDPTGDIGRIGRQQDFLRRAMQRALDRGGSSLRVANDLLSTALRNVITDDQLTPRQLLEVAQAMRDLDTGGVATWTIESSQRRIGQMAVLVPRLDSDQMRRALATFRGEAEIPAGDATGGATGDAEGGATGDAAGDAAGAAWDAADPSVRRADVVSVGPVGARPVRADHRPLPSTGIVPPDDPGCR
jgi:LCP family protein required for cell wall assembly